MTRPIDLYFMSTVYARDEARLPTRQAIVETMQRYGNVLDHHVVRPDAAEWDARNVANGLDVCARDYDWLDRADAGVAELSVPTMGGAMEVERFSLQGKPLLVLHEQGRSASLAGFLPRRRPNVQVLQYTTKEEAVNATDGFLRSLPEPTMQGKFIVIDGPDYCGKGTQHRMLIDYMLNHPQDRERKLLSVYATREPFNSPKAREVRDLLRNAKDVKTDPLSFAQLFTADRFIHAAQMRMAVAGGNIVLSDRYKYSTLAYQSLQGVPMEQLLKMHEGLPVPDLTLFIMTSLERRLQRKAADRERPYDEVFEKDKGFQEALQRKYFDLKEVFSQENIVLVDGDREREEIQTTIREHVDKLLFP